jgi:hypothetical protein
MPAPRRALALVLIAACAALSAAAVCQTAQSVAFVNPTQQALYVQVDQKPPFEVPPGGEVRATVPAIDRLTPISITARDARGQTVFFRAMSLPALQGAGNRVVLAATGDPFDPLSEYARR